MRWATPCALLHHDRGDSWGGPLRRQCFWGSAWRKWGKHLGGLRWGNSRWQGPKVGLCPAWRGAALRSWRKEAGGHQGGLRLEGHNRGQVIQVQWGLWPRESCWKVLSEAVAWSPISVANEPQEGEWEWTDELGDTRGNWRGLLCMVCNAHILSELDSNDQSLKLPWHFTVYLELCWHGRASGSRSKYKWVRQQATCFLP